MKTGPATPEQAARQLDWGGPGRPGQWTRVQRGFRDGHTETWWAADARVGPYRLYGPLRLVVATTDPATLPAHSSWYLATDFTRPDLPTPPHPARPGRPPPWPRSSTCTACAPGASKITSRSNTNWAGPTSRSAPTRRSAATGPWSTAPSPSAGTTNNTPAHQAPSRPDRPPTPPVRPPANRRPHRLPAHRLPTPQARPAGHSRPNRQRSNVPPCPGPALRRVRNWLEPLHALRHITRTCTVLLASPVLHALLDMLAAGKGLYLYVPP